MNFLELLTQIGNERVRVQNLDDCFTGARSRKGGITEISFETTAVSTTQLMLGTDEVVGYVVWLPKDKTTELLRK